MVDYDFLSVYFYSVPNLRFTNLNKLVKVRLGDICTITGGYAFDSLKMTQKGEYQIIKMGNLYNGIFDLSRNSSFINAPTKKELDYLIQENDILITLTGTTNKKDYGYTVQMEQPKNLLLNQRCALIRASKVNEKYLFYLLNSNDFLKQFYASSTGGTGNQTNVSINDMLDFKVCISNENDQLKISNILSALDKKILTQIKIIDDLVLQKKYIISSLLKSIQDNEKIMLKDILFDYIIKTTINNEYPVLSSTASGMYLQSDYFNKETSSDNTIGYKIVPRGYCTYRSMSDTGLFTFNIQNLVEKGIVSPAYPVFSSNDDYINEFIILYLNNSSYIKKQILELKSGGTRFALPFSTLCTLKIPKLEKEKQLSLIKTITAFERKIENEEIILNALHQQKIFLLNNMFI